MISLATSHMTLSLLEVARARRSLIVPRSLIKATQVVLEAELSPLDLQRICDGIFWLLKRVPRMSLWVLTILNTMIDAPQKPRCIRDTGSGTGYCPTRRSCRLELHDTKSQRESCTLLASKNAGWLQFAQWVWWCRYLGGRTYFGLDSMAYMRGSRDDWDKWAEIVEDDALKWDNMMPFIFKVSWSATQVMDSVAHLYVLYRWKDWFRMEQNKAISTPLYMVTMGKYLWRLNGLIIHSTICTLK